MIKQEFALVPSGAIAMEKRLLNKGLKVSHNKIHTVLKEHGLARKEPKKSEKRK